MIKMTIGTATVCAVLALLPPSVRGQQSDADGPEPIVITRIEEPPPPSAEADPRFVAAIEAQRLVEDEILELFGAIVEEDWERVLALCDEILAAQSVLVHYAAHRVRALRELGRHAEATAYEREISEGLLAHDAEGMRLLADQHVIAMFRNPDGDPEGQPWDLVAAARFARRAVELAPRDWGARFSLARVNFHRGETELAVEVQQRALSLMKEELAVDRSVSLERMIQQGEEELARMSAAR